VVWGEVCHTGLFLFTFVVGFWIRFLGRSRVRVVMPKYAF
jgi:hypothetical protein